MAKAMSRARLQGFVRFTLRKFGYLKVEYGFCCGRHWIEIDGKLVMQSDAAAVCLRDEDVHRLGYAIIDRGKSWMAPARIHDHESNA